MLGYCRYKSQITWSQIQIQILHHGLSLPLESRGETGTIKIPVCAFLALVLRSTVQYCTVQYSPSETGYNLPLRTLVELLSTTFSREDKFSPTLSRFPLKATAQLSRDIALTPSSHDREVMRDT
jgi:hypothetical protein